MDQHTGDYMLLGIRPGDSWDALRRAYRTEIRKWHPDRYAGDETQKRTAEERTKEINRAYRALQEYYETHGYLPLSSVAPPVSDADPIIEPDSVADTATTSNDSNYATATTLNPERRRPWRRVLVVSIVLGALVYYYVPTGSKPWDTSQNAPAGNLPAETPVEPAGTAPATERFTFGSTVGEVHAVQGIPTRIEGPVWYYDDAKVVFENGKVVQWTDSGNRLRADKDAPRPHERIQLFGKGSTKSEVRAIQGAPLRETDRVWSYGVSEVIFDGETVVGWHESPLDPLRVRR